MATGSSKLLAHRLIRLPCWQFKQKSPAFSLIGQLGSYAQAWTTIGQKQNNSWLARPGWYVYSGARTWGQPRPHGLKVNGGGGMRRGGIICQRKIRACSLRKRERHWADFFFFLTDGFSFLFPRLFSTNPFRFQLTWHLLQKDLSDLII